MKAVVLVRWTEYEYEPGWGASERNDGGSIHLNKTDFEAFRDAHERKVKATKADQPSASGYNCYWRPDGSQQIIDVHEAVYEDLLDKEKHRNGKRLTNEELKELLNGNDPWADSK